MATSKLTVKQTIALFESYIGKPRKALPWLKGRINMLDCAAAVSFVSGYKDIISCRVLRDTLRKNKTWTTKGLPKAGDVIIFDWSGNKANTDHTGIVIGAKRKLKGFVVTYVSADSTTPMPGLVSINKNLPSKFVTGWGRLVEYKPEPVITAPSIVPVPTTEQISAHN